MKDLLMYLTLVNAGILCRHAAYRELPIGARVSDDKSVVDGMRGSADR